MAFLQNISEIKNMLQKTIEMQYLYDFLQDSLNVDLSTKQMNKKEDLKYDMFVMFNKYALKNKDEAFFETHIKYIDFQLTINNYESFLIGTLDKFNKIKCDEEHDLIQYAPKNIDYVNSIISTRGDLCVFFDNDVHAGGIKIQNDNNANMVEKLVVKVPKALVKIKF